VHCIGQTTRTITVSEARCVTVQALHNHKGIYGIGYENVKHMGFDTEPEDSRGKCGSDVFTQTVPDTSSGDWKSSVTDGRQSGAADDQ